MKSKTVLSVVGTNNLTKLIDALVNKNGSYSFYIWTDIEQSFSESHKRGYTVEIADSNNDEQFEFINYGDSKDITTIGDDDDDKPF